MGGRGLHRRFGADPGAAERGVREVIDVGRARRTAPPATLRALRICDGGCVWPGCERSVAWTTAHHAAEWAKHKGGTNAATMVLLCYRHHWLVHEGGWQIARTDEGVITVAPLGGYVPGRAPDARPRRVVLDDHGEVHPTPGDAEAFGRDPAREPATTDVRRSPT